MESKILSRQIGLDSNYNIWHTNNSNMIIYMHSTGGSIVCNEKIYPIKEGALCFIGAQKHHYTIPNDANTYVRSKVFASTDEFRKILSYFPQKETTAQIFSDESFVYAEINEKDRSKVEALFDEISLYVNDAKYGQAIFLSCYTRLLIYISQSMIDVISLPHGFMNKAVEYINSNICKGIGIDDICEYTHMSKYHFCRTFKRATGLTVMEYILKTRIVLAKDLLVRESVSISDVSERCGFSSISYFCRVFKGDTGLTPLQYRKRLNTMDSTRA